MMRTAISPRLAIRTFLNMAFRSLRLHVRSYDAVTSQLERDIPVLLRRVGVALVLEHFQRIDQARAGFARLDDIVDVTALGRNIRIGEFLAVLGDQFRLALQPGPRPLPAPCGR